MIVDALQDGDAGSVDAREGAPASTAPSGSSLTRDTLGTDTNVNAAHFSIAVPSPGVGPAPRSVEPIPEPGTLLLLGSGLTFVAFRLRR